MGHTRTETALAPSSRVCPDPRLGSASSGPRPKGHEEHRRWWRVDPTPSSGARPRYKAKLQKTFPPWACLLGRCVCVCVFVLFALWDMVFAVVCQFSQAPGEERLLDRCFAVPCSIVGSILAHVQGAQKRAQFLTVIIHKVCHDPGIHVLIRTFRAPGCWRMVVCFVPQWLFHRSCRLSGLQTRTARRPWPMETLLRGWTVSWFCCRCRGGRFCGGGQAYRALGVEAGGSRP